VNKLLILSVLQLAILATILFVLLNGDREPRPLPSGQPVAVLPETTLQAQPAAAPAINATLIRNIVRSELDAFAARTPAVATDDEADANRIDPVETDARLSWARESIEYYRTVGEISEREIDEFQRELATLDPVNQKAMLSELFVEINKGNVRIRP
jgi:hypothetical protein